MAQSGVLVPDGIRTRISIFAGYYFTLKLQAHGPPNIVYMNKDEIFIKSF